MPWWRYEAGLAWFSVDFLEPKCLVLSEEYCRWQRVHACLINRNVLEVVAPRLNLAILSLWPRETGWELGLLLGWYTDSNASLTILCLFYWTIYLWPQFPISLLHLTKTSFLGAFFWGLQTASTRWEPDLKNRVGKEAILSAIHVVLPSLRLTCDTVHCLGERAPFSSSFVAVLLWFLPSNAPIMRYNICYWWFFISKGNRWTKYLAHPKIRKPKPYLLMFASLVALDGFHLLLSTQLTTYLTPEWSGGSMFHQLAHIYAKTLFLALKQLQTMLWIVDTFLFLIDCEKTRYPLWIQLSDWQMFMQNGE